MKNEFKVLSLSEERKLSSEELKKYYAELKYYLLKRKLTNTTPGATTIAPKLKGMTDKIAEFLVNTFSEKNVELEYDGVENIPDCPVIFAQSHQGLLDNFVWMPQIDKHSLILHHNDVNKILLLSQLNTGLVLIKKDDAQHAANAKLDVMSLLLRGHSVTWFPEGTYCLSPNKFHLPLKYGFIDVAKKTGAPIVPVVHEYTYDTSGNKTTIIKIQSKYGKPIYVGENDNLAEKLSEYVESISTLRYETIEAKGTFKRSDITNFDYIDFLKEIYKNIDISGVDKDYEREHIYTADDEFHKFFHINDVPFTEDGMLLETDEVIKLKTINQEHEIKKFEKLADNMHKEEEKKRVKKLQNYYQKNFK